MQIKVKTCLILCAVCIAITAAICIPSTYFLSRCEMEDGKIDDVRPGPELPPDPKPGVKNPYACGPTINIVGAMREGKFFTTASNNCMTVNREFELNIACPKHYYYYPYSIQIQLTGLVGYNKELEKFNALVGGTVSWIWNFKHGSVGLGITYLHGLVIPEYYAGATVTGQIDFGKKKTIDNL